MAKTNEWLSVSDLMTGLMVIFLFVAIAYISKVQKQQNTLADYVETRDSLHAKLVREFEADAKEWQMSIGKDLTMKFENPEVLFASGDYHISPTFQSILNEFIPRYFDILINDTLRFKISEIRIEGHTDNVTAPRYGSDPYMSNVTLSQLRSKEVLDYIRSMDFFRQYTDEQKALMEYWLTANGLSYGKALDGEGKYTYLSKKEINKERSRRVEFRIVTNGEEMLENFVKKNK